MKLTDNILPPTQAEATRHWYAIYVPPCCQMIIFLALSIGSGFAQSFAAPPAGIKKNNTSSTLPAAMVVVTYREVKRSELIVDDGEIRQVGSFLMVDSGEMRANIHGGFQRSASLDFTYLGPTSNVSRLADGEIRHQFGLKLRARDTCNLVYVMWRFDDSTITVAIKRNPGESTHRECLDHGYTTVGKSAVTAPVRQGVPHTLEAQLNGRILTVAADGLVVRTVNLGAGAMDFDGPVGLRSDNVKVRFQLSTVGK